MSLPRIDLRAGRGHRRRQCPSRCLCACEAAESSSWPSAPKRPTLMPLQPSSWYRATGPWYSWQSVGTLALERPATTSCNSTRQRPAGTIGAHKHQLLLFAPRCVRPWSATPAPTSSEECGGEGAGRCTRAKGEAANLGRGQVCHAQPWPRTGAARLETIVCRPARCWPSPAVALMERRQLAAAASV
ncbi:hypothetical protein M3J09_001043 [Ascochyta lentis]